MQYMLDQMPTEINEAFNLRYLEPEQVKAFLDNPHEEKLQLERES